MVLSADGALVTSSAEACGHSVLRVSLRPPLLMIKLENVTKVYKGDVVALRDASADIQKGEFLFLVGPSGSGKSTMLRLLNKEEVPDKGTIWVAGKDIGELGSW